MATLSGKFLGKYEVLERIGRGGMADVYKGRHERLDRIVAIKVLHSYLAEGDDFLARFEREARAVASLRHPNIVQVYDFDLQDDDMYMVMEYIGGGSLKDRLQGAVSKGRYLPFPLVIHVIQQIAAALDNAHAQGMLHRDVKPANVMLDEDGNAYLADFGIARIVSTTQFTATGTLVGTPAYMSPEQGRGEILTPASDLYSLGVILYEMLTNRIPFDADTPLAIIHKQIHDPLPPACELRADLPEAVEAVLERALAKDPSRRYKTASALVDALTAALRPGDVATVEAAPPSGDFAATVLMEPEVQPEEIKATVAMDAATESESDASVVHEPRSEASPALDREAVHRERVEAEKTASAVNGRKVNPAIIAGAVIIVLLAIAAASGLFSGGGGGCDGIEACLQAAEQAEAEGMFEDAMLFLEETAAMVPPDEEPAYAEIWCRHGHLNLRLDRPDEAIGSFERCAEWTHGIPELQGLIEEAEGMIMDITGG